MWLGDFGEINIYEHRIHIQSNRCETIKIPTVTEGPKTRQLEDGVIEPTMSEFHSAAPVLLAPKRKIVCVSVLIIGNFVPLPRRTSALFHAWTNESTTSGRKQYSKVWTLIPDIGKCSFAKEIGLILHFCATMERSNIVGYPWG